MVGSEWILSRKPFYKTRQLKITKNKNNIVSEKDSQAEPKTHLSPALRATLGESPTQKLWAVRPLAVLSLRKSWEKLVPPNSQWLLVLVTRPGRENLSQFLKPKVRKAGWNAETWVLGWVYSHRVKGRKPVREQTLCDPVLQRGCFLCCFWNFNLGCACGILLLFGEG